jgi:hypothetical protein
MSDEPLGTAVGRDDATREPEQFVLPKPQVGDTLTPQHRGRPRSGVERVELGLGDSLLVGVEPDVAEH